MANVILGNTSNGSSLTADNLLTVSHNVISPSGLNILIASILINGSTLPSITATYGGVAMTSLTNSNIAATFQRLHTFYIKNPPLGISDIVFTSSVTKTEAIGCGVDFGNVDSLAPIGLLSTSGASGTTASVSPVSESGSYVYAALAKSISETNTPLNSQTEIVDGGTTQNFTGAYLSSLSGTTTVGWSWVTSATYRLHAFALIPETPTKFFNMF